IGIYNGVISNYNFQLIHLGENAHNTQLVKDIEQDYEKAKVDIQLFFKNIKYAHSAIIKYKRAQLKALAGIAFSVIGISSIIAKHEWNRLYES
ncbi:MAG: hypothetical protein ACHQVS_04870, partial [Candidatus Babeliales bacterium]